MDRILSDEQVKQFNRDGFLIVSGFYNNDEITQVQRGIYEVIGHVMIKNGVPDTRAPFSPENFDQGYLDLIKRERAWGGEIYDAIKQIPAFFRLVANPLHSKIMEELRVGALPGVAAGGYGIRIDNPGEDKYRTMWHQEYPAQLRSVDGLVFWSPLVPITEEMGPVIFCPGSQVEGPLPVCVADPETAGRSGAYALKLHHESDYLSKYEKIAPLSRPRDLVIIDFLVLHASGYNRSERSRWSMQFRYFNFSEPIGRKHAWSGSYAAGINFHEVHPELFVI